RRRTTTRRECPAAVSGVRASGRLAVRVERPDEAAAMMARLRAAPPASLLDEPVTAVEDWAPRADVLVLRTGSGRLVVRPSGTEPKLKAYLEVVEPVVGDVAPARERARAALQALRTETAAVLGVA